MLSRTRTPPQTGPPSDSHHADAKARKIAGHRERHADDRALARRVRELSLLTLNPGNGGDVDNDTTLLVRVGLALGHGRCGVAGGVENAVHVQLVDKVKDAAVVCVAPLVKGERGAADCGGMGGGGGGRGRSRVG